MSANVRHRLSVERFQKSYQSASLYANARSAPDGSFKALQPTGVFIHVLNIERTLQPNVDSLCPILVFAAMRPLWRDDSKMTCSAPAVERRASSDTSEYSAAVPGCIHRSSVVSADHALDYRKRWAGDG